MKKTFLLTVGVTAAALMLAGCTPGGGVPSGGDEPSGGGGTPEPAPTVTVTAIPAPAADPDFGFTFFHEATIGSQWDQMSAQLHMPVAPFDECAWFGSLWNTEFATTSAYTDYRNPTSGATFFYTSYMQATDRTYFPRNAEGVGVGSTKAEILAAYPSAVVDAYSDPGLELTRIIAEDPDSDSKYAFGITGNYGENVADLLQWGPGAGNGWTHLCSGY